MVNKSWRLFKLDEINEAGFSDNIGSYVIFVIEIDNQVQLIKQQIHTCVFVCY